MPPTARLRDSGNALLDRLPHDEFDTLEPELQPVDLAQKQIVHEYNARISHVHFPTSALVSLLTVLEADDPVEAQTVGREGFIGLSASLGVTASPYRALCQMPGRTLRLPADAFAVALTRCPAFNRLVLRYVAFSLRCAGQGTACNALHAVEARASRWLLFCHDQIEGDEFPLTHEFLSFMLGVRRQSVTVVAGSLQDAGLIAYRRGVVTILDRPGLEQSACECYEAIRGYYESVVV